MLHVVPIQLKFCQIECRSVIWGGRGYRARGELAEKGAEVVYGDLNDQESISKAFEGAYGAFGVTNCAFRFSGVAETTDELMLQ